MLSKWVREGLCPGRIPALAPRSLLQSPTSLLSASKVQLQGHLCWKVRSMRLTPHQSLSPKRHRPCTHGAGNGCRASSLGIPIAPCAKKLTFPAASPTKRLGGGVGGGVFEFLESVLAFPLSLRTQLRSCCLLLTQAGSCTPSGL